MCTDRWKLLRSFLWSSVFEKCVKTGGVLAGRIPERNYHFMDEFNQCVVFQKPSLWSVYRSFSATMELIFLWKKKRNHQPVDPWLRTNNWRSWKWSVKSKRYFQAIPQNETLRFVWHRMKFSVVNRNIAKHPIDSLIYFSFLVEVLLLHGQRNKSWHACSPTIRCHETHSLFDTNQSVVASSKNDPRSGARSQDRLRIQCEEMHW